MIVKVIGVYYVLSLIYGSLTSGDTGEIIKVSLIAKDSLASDTGEIKDQHIGPTYVMPFLDIIIRALSGFCTLPIDLMRGHVAKFPVFLELG